MDMVCMNACTNAMNACTCLFLTRLSMPCINYGTCECMVHVNACMNAMNACAPQYLNHSPILKHTPRIYN